ncbi:MAG: YecA family protein [Burkholderiales bacterium]|nr:YecA family protein [Burkholderiales bacterium]
MPGPHQRPPARTTRGPDRARIAPPRAPTVQPLSDRELDELQALLDGVPAPLEPLDVSMLDGYLCGVLLQPNGVPALRWLPHVTDVDGRALPRGFDAARLHALVQRRHAELRDAIQRRQWFDPWVFELTDVGDDGAATADRDGDDADADTDTDEPAAIDAVYPWVAGFATALELFPALMALDAKALTEPLALVYRHLGADDLEDADELLAEIESIEPPADLSEAVEGLVRACLLLADVAQPLSAIGAGARPAPGRTRRPGPSDR